MSASNVRNSSESENTCIVCFKNVDVFSIGFCDHPVCFECSTRMRVLCNQLECPICRRELFKVIFTKEIEPYSVLRPKVERQNLLDRKYGLFFATPSIQRRYYRLLDHECFICRRNAGNVPFRTFQQLKDHMRRVHELFYCELCVSNLKIFTFERRCYTRVELATHRRKGDADNTSHRGHPLCEFCETRFMDNDELYRHLRRDHLFCHFCDADGKHQYYNVYNDLRKHYLEEHYLCEEGDCKHERFTSVFRTDIDLKAHYAAVHSKNLSKAATRQARTLELEFTLAPRSRPDGASRGSRHYGIRHSDRQNEDEGAVGYDTYYVEPGGNANYPENEGRLFTNPLASENFPTLGGDNSNVGPRTVSNVTITSKLNPLSEENFPSLGGGNSVAPRSSAVTITTTGKFNPRNTDDFPSLGGGTGSIRQPAVTITRTVRGQQGLKRNLANFPMLKESSSSSAGGSVRLSVNSGNVQDRPSSAAAHTKAPNVSIHVNHKPNGAITTRISQTTNGQTVSIRPKTVEDFPALGAGPVPQPQWVPQKAKKQQPQPEPKASKVAPAPVLPPSGLNDFPTLNKGVRKSTSVTVPVSNVWVNLNSFNSDVKNSVGLSGISHSSSETSNKQPKQERSKENGKSGGGGSAKSPKSTAKSSRTIELAPSGNNSSSLADSNESKTKNKKKKGRGGAATLLDELTNNVSKMKVDGEVSSKPKEEPEKASLNSAAEKNEIVKKRSELNIGALEVNNVAEDSTVPGASKPPPGFNMKPPPGFNSFTVTGNDLTFTNSSGQSYSIVPSMKFYPPPNFESRNQQLIERFMNVLSDSDAIQQFKVYSDMFRLGEIPAEKYYQHCKDFMGDQFERIFPELLVLLPNVQRQQDLYKVLQGNNETRGLETCATCKQIVLKNDLRNHLNNHYLDNYFPVLNEISDNSKK